MKKYFSFLRYPLFGTLLLLAGCNNNIKKFNVGELNTGGIEYNRLFDKTAISPLKDEWKELYLYLKGGHVLQGKDGERVKYIYSHEFYQFIKKNQLKIYDTPFLKNYKNFVTVFGDPERKRTPPDRIVINYIPTVIGDSCKTCQYDAFGFVFESNTKKLLKE